MGFITCCPDSVSRPLIDRNVVVIEQLSQQRNRCTVICIREELFADDSVHPERALFRKRSVSRELLKHTFDITVSDSPNIVTLFGDRPVVWVVVVERPIQ